MQGNGTNKIFSHQLAAMAQKIAECVVNAGIRGLLNYAPMRLNLPNDVYVENRGMIMAVEKAAYFARQSLEKLKI